MKIVEEGNRNEAIFKLLLANSREPNNVGGDFSSQLAALQTGAITIERIGRRYPELDGDTRHMLAAQWTRPVDGGRQWRFDPWHRAPFPQPFRIDDAMAIWREVRAAVLCIDAEDSPARALVAEADMARRRACFTDLTHRVMPGCGHMLHLEAPERVAVLIREFFGETRRA